MPLYTWHPVHIKTLLNKTDIEGTKQYLYKALVFKIALISFEISAINQPLQYWRKMAKICSGFKK